MNILFKNLKLINKNKSYLKNIEIVTIIFIIIISLILIIHLSCNIYMNLNKLDDNIDNKSNLLNILNKNKSRKNIKIVNLSKKLLEKINIFWKFNYNNGIETKFHNTSNNKQLVSNLQIIDYELNNQLVEFFKEQIKKWIKKDYKGDIINIGNNYLIQYNKKTKINYYIPTTSKNIFTSLIYVDSENKRKKWSFNIFNKNKENYKIDFKNYDSIIYQSPKIIGNKNKLKDDYYAIIILNFKLED